MISLWDSGSWQEPQGFDVVIEPVDIQIQRNQPYDVYMLEHDYVGSFVIGFSLADPWLKDFENSCTPTVLYDNYITGNPSTAYVGIDNDEGMELAVSHLVRQGHRKIAYLSNSLGSQIIQIRYSAFFRSMRKHGLKASYDNAGLFLFSFRMYGKTSFQTF